MGWELSSGFVLPRLIPLPFHISRKTILLFFVIAVFWPISGCQFIQFFTPDNPSPKDINQTSSAIKKIYIQSFTGLRINQVQKVFFEAIAEQDIFEFVELLPDNYQDLSILRINVVDYSFAEPDELIKTQENASENSHNILRRRNINISIIVSLFNAETGQLIINKLFSQPFQQIYIGKEAIENRPDGQKELQRLNKILIFKILSAFYHVEKPQESLTFEKGSGHEWFSNTIQDLGDKRIKKGNRLALAGETEKAIWMWKLVIFEPLKGEPKETYIVNRAAAYYNLGVMFHQKKDWWFAAKMFSHANRIKQTLKYAQAWGDSIQLWLEEQENGSSQKTGKEAETKKETLKAKQKQPIIKKPIEKEKEDLIKSLEKNDQFLLKPLKLWRENQHLLKKKKKELEMSEKLKKSDDDPNRLREKESLIQKPAADINEDLIQEIPDN